MLSGSTIAQRPPSLSNCNMRSINNCSGGTLLCKRAVLCQLPFSSFCQICPKSNCPNIWVSCMGILEPKGGFVTITSKRPIVLWLRIVLESTSSAVARYFFVSSAHSCGGSKVLSCTILPLPSLFITIFILVAFTRSGLISKPKKFFAAVSEIFSL